MNQRFQLQATFVAYVEREGDSFEPGMLYARVASSSTKPMWVRLSQGEGTKSAVAVYFESREAAIEDARNFTRCGNFVCITEIAYTPFSEQSLQYIINHLHQSGTLKVA